MTLLLTMLFGAVGAPLPVGLPPLPEDPALLRAAPPATLAYVQWAGMTAPNQAATNRTEQLAAEPDVQALVTRVLEALRGQLRQELRGHEFARADRALRLALELAQRPGCVFLSELDVRSSRVRGGLVVHLGDRAESITAAVRSLAQAFFGRDVVQAGDDGVETLALPDSAPPVSFQVLGEHLVLGVGEGTTAAIAGRLHGDGKGLAAHASFARLHAGVRVERPCLRTFVDVRALLEQLPLPEQPSATLKALGLAGIRTLMGESGLDGDGYAARMMLEAPERGGLLSLLDGKPLAPADLAIVPGDATVAVVARAGAARYWSLLIELAGQLSPRGPGAFEREVAGSLHELTGVRLAEDLLAHCGDTVAVWNSPEQGGLLFPGIVAAVSLTDAAKFRESFTKLMVAVQEKTAPRRSPDGRLRRGVYLQKTELAGQTVWWLNTVGDDVPFAPAWCVTEHHLLFSPFPQPLKAAIQRGASDAGSLAAAHPDLLTPETRAVSFVDMQRLLDLGYPALMMLAQLACAEMQREGFALDVTALPSITSLRPHLRTSLMRAGSSEHGLTLERRGTLPFADPLVGALLPASLAIFAWRSAVARDGAVREARAAALEAELRRAEAEARRRAEEKRKQEERRK